MVMKRKTLQLSEDFQGANENLTGLFSAENLVIVKLSAKVALAVGGDIAEKGSSSNDMYIADVDKKVHGNSSARATISRAFTKARVEKASKGAVAHFVVPKRSVQT